MFFDAVPVELAAHYRHGKGTEVQYTAGGKSKGLSGPGRPYHKAGGLDQLLMQLNSAVFKVPIDYRTPEKYYASHAQKALAGV